MRVAEAALRLAVVLVVVVTVDVAAAGDGGSKIPQKERERERRMTPREREAVMEKIRRNREGPPCVTATPPPNNKPLPTLPHSYTTELELTHQEEGKQKVLYGAEAFDRQLNMGLLDYELREGIVATRPYDKRETIHYSLTQDEALIITSNTACEDEGAGNCDPKKTCKAKDLRGIHLELRELFGLGEANGNTGYFGISGILQWATQLNYLYGGQTVCRGMECDKFEVCIKNEREGTTALITYYWSLPNWTVDSNDGQVPLAIEVISDGHVNPYFTRKVEQRYDFYEFYSNIRPSINILEPPADVYCSKRESVYLPPKAPRFFAYNSETISPITLILPNGENQTHTVELTITFNHFGYYDWDSKITMSDFIPWYIFNQEYRYELETRRVQDFNQGITYNLYKHLKYCTLHRMENITDIGDVVVENGTVSLLPPWLFLELDGPWQYNGLHQARGVEADVWVGQRDLLLGFLLKESYVTYYSSPLVIDEPLRKRPSGAAHDAQEPEMLKEQMDDKSKEQHGKTGKMPREYISLDKVPLKLERYLNIYASLPHLITNIYDYQTQPPYTHTIDISLCYEDVRKRSFLLEIPPDSVEQVKGLRDNLLHAVQLALAEVGVVSPLRVNRGMLEFRDGKTYVLFTLLPLPPVVGDSPGAAQESDLDTASDLIIDSVANGNFIIIVHLDGLYGNSIEPVYVVLPAKSITEVPRGDDDTYTYTTEQKYGSGDMAGLAIGMLVVGALVGVVASIAWLRREGTEIGLPRVAMARKSPLSPASTINISSDLTAASEI